MAFFGSKIHEKYVTFRISVATNTLRACLCVSLNYRKTLSLFNIDLA